MRESKFESVRDAFVFAVNFKRFYKNIFSAKDFIERSLVISVDFIAVFSE
jgi:hypothetical protein